MTRGSFPQTNARASRRGRSSQQAVCSRHHTSCGLVRPPALWPKKRSSLSRECRHHAARERRVAQSYHFRIA
jgi:hypothetical protein